MKATDKQIRYVKCLLSKCGLGNKRFLGAWASPWLNGRERSGAIDNMTLTVASKLIDGLKEHVAIVEDAEDDDNNVTETAR